MQNKIFLGRLSAAFSFFLAGAVFLYLPTSSVGAENADTDIRFEIKNFVVEGDPHLNVVPTGQVLAPFIGPNKNFAAVSTAVQVLEQAFHDHGHPAVRVIIPEQEFNNGIVRLVVVEAKVGEVRIKGNRFFDSANILRSVPSLSPGASFDAAAISRNLSLANTSPSKKTFLQLSNGRTADLVDADLTVNDEKFWKMGLGLDNTGNAATGRFRQSVLLQHANLFNRDHRLSLQYITSPTKPEHVNIYGVGYEIPLYQQYATVDMLAVYSDVDSGTLDIGSSGMRVSGSGVVWGLHYSQQLKRIDRYEQKITLGLDSRTYQNNVDLNGIDLGNDITVHPISLTYSGNLVGEKGLAGFYVGASHNLPGGWERKDRSADFETARSEAPEGYDIFRSGAQLNYALPGGWRSHLSADGQYTQDQLVSGEQYSLGGAGNVRGFRESELSNDRGYSTSAELYTPDMAHLFGIKGVQWRWLVFYDTGYVSRVAPLPGETKSSTIASFGPGLRIDDGKNFSFSLDYGIALDSEDGSRDVGNGICHFKLNLIY